MPISTITDEVFLKDIKKGIAEVGVYVIGVSDESESVTLADFYDAFVYSIGHKEKGRPDILIPCGDEFSRTYTLKELNAKMNSAAALINHLVQEWDNTPVNVNDTAEDRDGKIYIVALNTIEGVKEEITIQATNYYGSTDYDILLLIPKQVH